MQTDTSSLTGTSKQVVWAEQIRASRAKDFDKAARQMLATIEKNGGSAQQIEQVRTLTTQAIANLLSESSAAAWIDNQFQDADTELHFAVKACLRAAAQ